MCDGLELLIGREFTTSWLSIYLHDRAFVLLTALRRQQNTGNGPTWVRYCEEYQRQKVYLLPCNDKGQHVSIARGSGQTERSVHDHNRTKYPGNSNSTGKSLYQWQTGSFFPQHYQCTCTYYIRAYIC